MRDARQKSFLKWASHSLFGHVVLIQIVWSPIMSILFLWLNYSDGTLTPVWALYTVIVASFSGVILAILFWYTVSLPFIKRYKKSL